jgi:arginyl-tRNA synthetase
LVFNKNLIQKAKLCEYERARDNRRNLQSGFLNINEELLTDELSYELVKELSKYEDKVREAAFRYEPSVLARYVCGLASALNKFCHECNKLNATDNLKEARLALVFLTQKLIKDAMGLLGIGCLKEM